MLRPRLFYLAVAILLTCGSRGLAGWEAKTSGVPLLQHYAARDFGTEGEQWVVHQDNLGRLLVGGAGLLVFDGLAWKTYPIGNSYAVRTLQFDQDGRLWVAGANELGYVDEPSIGNFQYHSLVGQLPADQLPFGEIWGCAVVERRIYFVGREKVYGWDGKSFQSWRFPSEGRLFPVKLGNEAWFQHLETGLYRLTPTGPQLEYDRGQLPSGGMLGITRDREGIIVISSSGMFRPGHPAVPCAEPEVQAFIANNRLSAYAALPDGGHAIGTINGGLALVGPDGKLRRKLDAADGLPSRTIFYLDVDRNGTIWGTSQNGVFCFDGTGRVTIFNELNGLRGGIQRLAHAGDRFYTINPSGVYRLSRNAARAEFQQLPGLAEWYRSIGISGNGLLLGRHGGLDYFDGSSLHNIQRLTANGIQLIRPESARTDRFLAGEFQSVGLISARSDGSFDYQQIASLSDTPIDVARDAGGLLWISTGGRGIFVQPEGANQPVAIPDPTTDKPFLGFSFFLPHNEGLLVFSEEKVFRSRGNSSLVLLQRLPGVRPSALAAVPGHRDAIVAFRRLGSGAGQGVGRLSLGDDGRAEWHELDVPGLGAAGLIDSITFSDEDGRQILWLGGADGLLRADYAALPVLAPPSAPTIRLDTQRSTESASTRSLDFPFAKHRLSFRIFAGDHLRSQGWSFETRLGPGQSDWSGSANRRIYEFSNLSEGDYRFEVRAVNPAGQASEPAVFTFRILPPWYRSPTAYGGYAVVLVLGIWGLIRFRERQIVAQNEKLEAIVQVRTQELVKANAAKDEFLAGVSHEIRNPMNGVIGIAESLKTSGLDADNRRKFGLLRQCANHLASLLEDILDISKMQAGVIELDVQPFDLHELVDAVAAMAAPDSEKYKIPVEVAISPAVPRYLEGDSRRIRQILLNFVSNALKFSGRGQVNVTIWCKPTGTPDKTEVIFAVSDDGPGISPEEQKRLFQRFERGAAARHGRVPGTGLGLALCKGYAERMGGRLWLESEPGHGSCFYFSALLPVVAAPPESDAPPPAEVPPQAETMALVVDDQEYNRIVLADLLAGLGYRVFTSGEGVEALALAETHPFQLIFLDYDLPGVSGLQISRAIRALTTPSARAHIFATTAFSTPEKQAQCIAAGMNAFLGKPVTLERLRKALAQAEGTTPPPPPSTAPADPLANLRLLAGKKGARFEDELALYVSELQFELQELSAAIQDEDVRESGHYAHLLCGRSSFIYERELEQVMRQIEETVAHNRWGEARLLLAEAQKMTNALPVRLASAAPTVPPASGR